MELDVNKVIAEYDRIVAEMNKRIIILKVENDMLKERLKVLENERD